MMGPAQFAEQADEKLAAQDRVRALVPFVPLAPAPAPVAPTPVAPQVEEDGFLGQLRGFVLGPLESPGEILEVPGVSVATGGIATGGARLGMQAGRSLGLGTAGVRQAGAVGATIAAGAASGAVAAGLTLATQHAPEAVELVERAVHKQVFGRRQGEQAMALPQQHQPGASVFTMQRGAAVPMGAFVTKVWTNPYTGLKGAKLSDGRMVAQRKDGSLKVYRPEKPIVVTRNPRLRSFVRAEERLHKLGKRMKKVLK